jgi:hypothetical protein
MKSGEWFRAGFILNPMARPGGCSGRGWERSFSLRKPEAGNHELLPGFRLTQEFQQSSGREIGDYSELLLDTDQSENHGTDKATAVSVFSALIRV